jgi:UPF0716 family protein affecting phage T7 exclusion
VNYITLVLLFASGSAQKNGSFLTINIVRLARGETFDGEFHRKDDERDRLDHKDDR